MIGPSSSEWPKLVDSFKILKMTPEGQMIMQYLQAVYLYANPSIRDVCNGQVPGNDEQLGHHRVILHMMSMMEQL